MTEDLIHELLRRQDTFTEHVGALARNQEAMLGRMESSEGTQEAILGRMDGLERNQAASSEEHRQLMEFLGRKFGRIDARFEGIDARFEAIDARFEAIDGRFEGIDGRFEAMDHRFVKLEIGLEGVRDEVKILAEGIVGTNERLDRFLERLEGRPSHRDQ